MHAEHSPLGKASEYIAIYTPSLLFPIPRAGKWAELGLTASTLPYQGVDYWNCYELSWLLPSGKPVVAIGEFAIPADSPNIIESKSFKLYLNSLNQTSFADWAAVHECLEKDLSATAAAPVQVRLKTLEQAQAEGVFALPGHCIDDLDVQIDRYAEPGIGLLETAAGQGEAILHSHLLKSNCPVTGQPDWGSVVVDYVGNKALEPASLLRYLVSFRQHSDFHEQCVERIFVDLTRLLAPERLTVYARYVRRGGLDINPYRSTHPLTLSNARLARQ